MGRRLGFGIVAVLLLSACAQQRIPEPEAGFRKPISFSILEDYDKGQDLKQVEADFLLFKELGITTWRGSFGWDDYEPEPGAFDFAWLHRFAELAARHRIELRPYVAYTPAWAAKAGGNDSEAWNNPPARLEEWRRFMKRLASAMRTHTNVVSFEIYNEENSPMWWDGSPREYAQVLASGAEAVRSADGDDHVLLGGITYPDLEWMEAICATHGEPRHFDILPLHVYAETWPEETAVESLFHPEADFHGTFLPEVDEKCGRKPVWINEAGYATTPGKRTERDQANWWARAIATFVADRRVEHIGIYEIKDRPRTEQVIGEPENYYLGLTYADRRPKLAFHTVRQLVRLLDAGTLAVADEELSVEVTSGKRGALYHHLFIRPDGRQVLLLWDKTGAPALKVTLPRTGAQATEHLLDGTEIPYPRFDGRRLQGVKLLPGEVRIFEILP